MMDKQAAFVKAHEYIASLRGPELVILKDETIEHPKGWVFFTDSKQHLETGEFRHKVIGNSPIFIDLDGNAEQLPTFEDPLVYLEQRARGEGS